MTAINLITDKEDADSVREKINQLIQQYPILANDILARATLQEAIPSVAIASANSIAYTVTDTRFSALSATKYTEIVTTPTVTNTTNAPTLSLNAGTVYPIVDRHGNAYPGLMTSGIRTTLIFDTNKWVVQDSHDVFSTTSNATLSATVSDNKYSATINGYTNTPYVIIPVTFDKTNTLAGTSLVVNGGTAYPLKKNGVAITAYQVRENETMYVYFANGAYNLFGAADSGDAMKMSSYDKAAKISKIVAGMSLTDIIEILVRMLDDRSTSSYGITWEALPSFNETWNDICYGMGLFVSVGNSKVMISTDNGKTWTKITTGVPANNWVSVTYMPTLKMFVASATSGTNRMMYSPDGYNWSSSITSPGDLQWVNVTVGKIAGVETVVAVCTDGVNSNHIATTTDGKNWTLLAYATYTVSQTAWSKCKYGKLNNVYGFMFLPVSNSILSTNTIHTLGVFSSDLKTSTDVKATFSVDVSTTMYLMDLSYYNDQFVLISKNGSVFLVDGSGTGYFNAIVCELKPTLNAGDPTWKALINKNGMFIAVANSGDTVRCKTSPDGFHWNNRVLPLLLGWTALAAGPNHVIGLSATASDTNIIRSGKEADMERFSGLLISDVFNGTNATYDNGIWSAYKIAALLAAKSDKATAVPFVTTASTDGIAYTITNTGVDLKTGLQLTVVFNTYNASTVPTIAYNGGGAKQIKQATGSNISVGLLKTGWIYNIIYDGTYWRLLAAYNSELIAETTTGTEPAYILTNGNMGPLTPGLIIPLKFHVTNSTTSPTLNANNTGALALKIEGRNPYAGEIQAGDFAFVVYSAGVWQIVGSVKRGNGLVLTGYVKPTSYSALAANDLLNSALGKLEAGMLARLELCTTKTEGKFDSGAVNPDGTTRLNYNGYMYATRFYGAVYNDYAEYRSTISNLIPGIIVTDDILGRVEMARKRCCKNPMVVSDTYGFAIGQTSDSDVPIAVCGRALVYIDNKSKIKIGDPICSNAEGIGTKMHWWEKILFPERMLGTVSEIPTYTEWGGKNNIVPIDGRIWVMLK